jgi:iron complex outermembrane receptor protein
LINPFGESGAAGLDLLRSAQVGGTVRDAKGTIDQLDFHVSRDMLKLSGGPLAVALGGEWRRERLTDNPSEMLASGEVVGIRVEIDPQQASRTVSAAFAEVNVPIVRALEVGASVRYDHYSDFGGTTNPKVALRWQPVPSLLMRGTWGTGFRAPSLPDLYTPQSYAFFTGFPDPIRCPVTNAPADCGQGEFVYVYGGNRELRPETSTQYSAGVIWEPVPGVSLGLEWWQISKDNLIVWFTPAEVFSRYDELAPGHVIRGPVDPAYPGLPGPIEAIVGTKENMGGITTSGIDVTISARLPTATAGTFGFSLTGTYIDRFSVDDTGTGSFDVAGRWALAPVPRWRHYAAINWQLGSWGATLAQLYQDGYVDANPNPAIAPRDVSSYSLWNLQGVYTGFRNWSIAAGVRNLFDTDPPFTNQQASQQIGYDPNYGDPRGRAYYLRLTYAFK